MTNNHPDGKNKMKITKSCLGLDCPERKSLCCGAYSTVSEGGGFICANCGKQFRGGECTAGENNPFSLSVPIPNGMELTNAKTYKEVRGGGSCPVCGKSSSYFGCCSKECWGKWNQSCPECYFEEGHSDSCSKREDDNI